MRFVCLGCIDPAVWSALSEDERNAWMEECFAYDDELRRSGYFLQGEGLLPPHSAVTVRTRQGAVQLTSGPFAETKEILGGRLFLEARDLNHAIQLISRHPGTRHGTFEIRGIDEALQQRVNARASAQ